MPEWKREPPNAEGNWLRWSAGHVVVKHYVCMGFGKDLRGPGVLKTMWGWLGQEKFVPVTHEKLKGWLWYGPIPNPDEEPYRPNG